MMTKYKKLWISSAIALGVCAITFFSQRSGISAVRGKIEGLQKAVTEASETASVKKNPAVMEAFTPQTEKLSVEELVAMLSDEKSDTVAQFTALDDMLEHIKHYSTDDVLELIEALRELIAKDKSQEQKVGFLEFMLMVIAAEHAPERILEMAKKATYEFRSAAFAGLAKKNPQRAGEYLKDVEWSAGEVRMARTVLFSEWLKRDVAKALDLFRDGGWSLNSEVRAAIGNACNDPAIREKLWKAAREETDPAVRVQLSKELIASELVRGGAAGMRKAFASADFFDTKLKTGLVAEFAGEVMASEPDEVAAWIREAVPSQDVPQALADALGSWALSDFNAAGTWLGKQANSPERDQAIVSFASTVSIIDPAAAAEWVDEIDNPTLRQTALKKTLKRWQKMDPAAAEAWIEAQAAQE